VGGRRDSGGVENGESELTSRATSGNWGWTTGAVRAGIKRTTRREGVEVQWAAEKWSSSSMERVVEVVCRTSLFLRGFADMIWVWRLLPDESLQQRGRRDC
jgi:hypothetical protein